MIISKLVSGLGNQLFQYAMGRRLAVARQVPLKLDKSFFGGQSLRSYKLDHYPIVADIATEKEVSNLLHPLGSVSLINKLYQKVQGKMPVAKRRHFVQSDWWVYQPEISQLSPNTYVEGYWQNFRYWQNFPTEIIGELRLSSEQMNPYSELVDKINDSPNSVAVHIRRGDYVTDKNANNLLGVLPQDYYALAIDYFKKAVKRPEFFFFSDDLNWVKDNLVVDGPGYYVEEGEDYIQLELMSRCKHAVIANSSFSWWGAFLNQNASKIVVAPQQWVVSPQLNSQVEIQMPSWVLL